MVQGLEMNRTVLLEDLKSTFQYGDQGMDGRTITTYSKEIGLDHMDIIYQVLLNTVMERWVLKMCGTA
jgi:hypothetical protein